MTARRGFTLVEMIACLAILALAAGVATVSLRSRTREAAMGEAAARFAHMDRLARETARRDARPGLIHLDLSRDRFGEFEIEQVRLGRDRAVAGQVAIACSFRGQTPTYAVKLTHGQDRQWILVSGLTGQVELVNDETRIDDILSLCASRDDAD